MSLHTQAMKGMDTNNAPVRKGQTELLKYLKLLNIIWYIARVVVLLQAKTKTRKHYGN